MTKESFIQSGFIECGSEAGQQRKTKAVKDVRENFHQPQI
jgi:hypothetical protein